MLQAVSLEVLFERPCEPGPKAALPKLAFVLRSLVAKRHWVSASQLDAVTVFLDTLPLSRV